LARFGHTADEDSFSSGDTAADAVVSRLIAEVVHLPNGTSTGARACGLDAEERAPTEEMLVESDSMYIGEMVGIAESEREIREAWGAH